MVTVSQVSETYGFFKQFLGDPRRVAALLPSSRALARLITSEVDVKTGSVIELGVGTGVFTRALMERGVAESALILVERGSDFADRLRLRYPRARTLCMDAARLARTPGLSGLRAGAVVSGLPLLSMPPRRVLAILSGAFSLLSKDGCFYQFTYGPRCPIPRAILERLDLKAVHIGHTFRNMPPASVYRIKRRTPLRLVPQPVIDSADGGSDSSSALSQQGIASAA